MRNRFVLILLVTMFVMSNVGLAPVQAQGNANCVISVVNGAVTVGDNCTPADVAAVQEKLSSLNGPADIVALGYDEAGAGLAPNQVELAALTIRRLQSAVWSAKTDAEAQKAMEHPDTGIPAIQKMAAVVGATRYEGDTLALPFGVTWLVWCSNGTQVKTPADVSYPLKVKHKGVGQVYIWSPPSHYDAPPDPSEVTFSGCIGGKIWAVALQ